MPDDLLPELDTPPTNGVFVDWEDEREREIRRRSSARFLVDLADDIEDVEDIEGNLMGQTIDPDDDFDSGL